MIGSYEPEAIETATGIAYRTIYRLERTIQEPIAKKLVETIRGKIEEFKEHMPVIATLGNPSLKSRHWEEISEIVGFPIKVDESMTLAKVTHVLFSLDESVRFDYSTTCFVAVYTRVERKIVYFADPRLRSSRLRCEIRSNLGSSNKGRELGKSTPSNASRLDGNRVCC